MSVEKSVESETRKKKKMDLFRNPSNSVHQVQTSSTDLLYKKSAIPVFAREIENIWIGRD